MPERNLVSSNRIVTNTVCLLTALTLIVATQLGCQKLRNSSFNQDVFGNKPAMSNSWVEPLRSEKGTETIESVTQPPRFNNDPTEALEELNREAGNISARVDQESADAKIVAVSQESIDTEKKSVKLVAKPPAPTLQSGFALNPAESMPAPTIPQSTIDSSANLPEVSLASFPQTELRQDNFVSPIQSSMTPQLDDPKDSKDDSVNPSFQLVSPFPQPIEPPSISNQAPPSELVSQPLAPILFDEVTREVQIPVYNDEENTLRSPRELLFEKPAVGVIKQDQMLIKEPTQYETQALLPIQTEPVVMPKTAYSGFEKARCAECESAPCDGDCPNVVDGPRMDLRPKVSPERVVIVATTSEDTIPPHADPPVETEYVFNADVVLPNVQAPNVSPSEFEMSVPEKDSVVMGVIEKVDLHQLDEQQWAAILGPIPVPPNEFTAKPSQADCVSGQCDEPKSGKPKTFIAAVPDNEFLPPLPIQFPVEESKTDFAQPEPHEFPSNDFQASNFAPVSHDAETRASNWQPEDSNFIPTEFSEAEIVELPEPKLVDAKLPESPVANPTLNRFSDPFPVVDTTIPIAPKTELQPAPALTLDPMPEPTPVPQPKPEVIIEVVDNTVPWSVKLVETIDAVRNQLNREADPMSRNGLAVNLRLLEVLQRQMITVEENQSSLSNNERQYWDHQLDAIALMLPSTGMTVSDLARHNTAYETLDHLRKAVERLESIAKLKVAGGRFCAEITGFGKFKPFPSTEFKPGQRTLVYCEVENYLSNAQMQSGQTTFHTRLRGSYVVYDRQGRVVQQAEYPIVEDVARQRRRDFYMYFPIEIGKLAPGAYTLELLVEDLSSNKTASLEPGMTFTVR